MFFILQVLRNQRRFGRYRKVEWIGFSLQQARRNIWGRWGQILSQPTLWLAEKYIPFFGEDTSCAKIVHCNRFAPVFYLFWMLLVPTFIRVFRRACGWPAILVVAPSSLWRQRTRRSRVKEKESNSRRRTVGSLSKIEFFWSQKIWIWRTPKNHGLKKVVKEKESNSAQWEIGPAASYLDQEKFGSNP